MKIKVKKLNDSAVVPTKGTKDAAGYDLYANLPDEPVSIEPGATVKIGTGICMEIPDGYWGGVYARSGLALKKGLRPANCVGVIDSDYRGEICVALHNDSDEIHIITDKDRIAQLVIQSFLEVEFDESDNLNETDRGDGGFGSTDK